MLRLKDSMKNIAFKESLYRDIQEGKLKINLEKTIKREEKLYARTKFRRKVNRILISKVEYLGTSSRYQKLDLKNYVNTSFYKKKVLTSLTSIVGGLYKKHVFKAALKPKPPQMNLEGRVKGFLSKIALRLSVLGGLRYFFKKVQKDKKLFKARGGLKAKDNKESSHTGYSASQIKKKKMYITEKLKK